MEVSSGPNNRIEQALRDFLMGDLFETTPRPPNIAMLESRIHLGSLELQVMEILWSVGRPLSVTEVHNRLKPRAYTTILTVLRNLLGKGMISRVKLPGHGQQTDHYSPVLGRQTFVQEAVNSRLNVLLDEFPVATLAALLDRIAKKI